MLDGYEHVVRSTSKAAPLRDRSQLSHRERNKIEKLANKHGRVYVIDVWDGHCKLVCERLGVWMTVEDYRALELERMEADARSGDWLTRALDSHDPGWRETP